MKIFYSIENIKINKPVLTVGTFDGVHLGHKDLLLHLVKKAKEIGGESVVFSFFPHPRQVIFPDSVELKHLNTQKEKIKLLEDIGVDNLIIYPFTKEFAEFDSCYFINNILHKQLDVNVLVVGHDHHFGRDRQGDFDKLKQCAKPLGIELEKVGAFKVNNVNVSSTKIRNALIDGKIQKANAFLGYNFSLHGKVVHGNKIGRQINFPTANLYIIDVNKIIPKDGVYAVEVLVGNEKHQGMLNIGKKPTVKRTIYSTVEVHIFDFEKTIYDSQITIFFKEFVREEIKFENLDELKIQLTKDKKLVLNVLNKVSFPNK